VAQRGQLGAGQVVLTERAEAHAAHAALEARPGDRAAVERVEVAEELFDADPVHEDVMT